MASKKAAKKAPAKPAKQPAKKRPAKKAPPQRMKQPPLPHMEETTRRTKAGLAVLRAEMGQPQVKPFKASEVRIRDEETGRTRRLREEDEDEEDPDDLEEAGEAVEAEDEELEIPGSRGTSVLMQRAGRLTKKGRKGARKVRRVVSYLPPSLWSELDGKARSVGFTLSECMTRAVTHWLKLPEDVQTAVVKNRGVESR